MSSLVPSEPMSTERRLLKMSVALNEATFNYYLRPQLFDLCRETAGPHQEVRLEAFVEASKDALKANDMIEWKITQDEQEDDDTAYTMGDQLEWSLHPQHDDVGETGLYCMTVVERRGNDFNADARHIAFGNCLGCFRAGPLGIRCQKCNQRFLRIYFVPRYEGYGDNLRAVLTRTVCDPFKLGHLFKAVPQLDIDARTYDQNPDYVEDVHTASVTTLVEITTLIDKWQDKAFDPTYGNAIEMELKVATSTTLQEVEDAFDRTYATQWPQEFREQVMNMRTLRNENHNAPEQLAVEDGHNVPASVHFYPLRQEVESDQESEPVVDKPVEPDSDSSSAW